MHTQKLIKNNRNYDKSRVDLILNSQCLWTTSHSDFILSCLVIKNKRINIEQIHMDNFNIYNQN